MEFDPAPFMAKEVVSSNKKQDNRKATIFSNLFRFIDNLSTTNNLKIFTKKFILISWNSIIKIKILVKSYSLTFK